MELLHSFYVTDPLPSVFAITSTQMNARINFFILSLLFQFCEGLETSVSFPTMILFLMPAKSFIDTY